MQLASLKTGEKMKKLKDGNPHNGNPGELFLRKNIKEEL